MQNNDRIKGTFDDDTVYTGRYLVFGYEAHYPGGGQGDVVGSFNSYAEIEALFRLAPDGSGPLKTVTDDGQVTTIGYDFLEVLDMDKRQFIDINELHFLSL